MNAEEFIGKQGMRTRDDKGREGIIDRADILEEADDSLIDERRERSREIGEIGGT